MLTSASARQPIRLRCRRYMLEHHRRPYGFLPLFMRVCARNAVPQRELPPCLGAGRIHDDPVMIFLDRGSCACFVPWASRIAAAMSACRRSGVRRRTQSNSASAPRCREVGHVVAKGQCSRRRLRSRGPRTVTRDDVDARQERVASRGYARFRCFAVLGTQCTPTPAPHHRPLPRRRPTPTRRPSSSERVS